MPSGRPDIIGPALNRIMKMDPSSILDVGPGFGKWGFLLREYLEVWQGRLHPAEWEKRIDAVEIYVPYASLPWNKTIYDDVFVGDVLDYVRIFPDYDLILFMDVIEHIKKPEGLSLLRRAPNWILSTPAYESQQGEAFGNRRESHISAWSVEDFDNAVLIGGKWILAWGSGVARVYSHPRSGTHLLAATLERCFFPDVDLTGGAGWAGHWAGRFQVSEKAYAGLIGNHRRWDASPGKCIYLLRDGRDVAVSFWRTKAFQHPSWRGLSFSEYLRKPLNWENSPGFKASPGLTIAEHWLSHLKSWRGHDNVHYVRFEELLSKPEETLRHIGKFLETEPKTLELPAKLVGLMPNEGRVGVWHEYFSDEDLSFFYSKVPPDYWGLWQHD